jgi:hypothetical protein
MLKKKNIFVFILSCVMLTSCFATVDATEFRELPRTFYVEGLTYTNVMGVYNETEIRNSDLSISFSSTVVTNEEITDIETGVGRKLTLNTQVNVKTGYDINDIIALVRSDPIKYDWLGLDFGADTVAGADRPYMMTSMTHDELQLLCESLPISEGILDLNLKYNTSTCFVKNSQTTILNEEIVSSDVSSLDILSSAKMGSKEDLREGDTNFFGQTIIDMIAESDVIDVPYRFVRNDDKIYQNEYTDFNVFNYLKSDLISISIEIEMKPQILQMADVFMPTVQITPVARASTWDCSTPTSISQIVDSGVAPFGIRVVEDAQLLNVERTITLQTIVEIDVIDESFIKIVPKIELPPIDEESLAIGISCVLNALIGLALTAFIVTKKMRKIE